MRHTCSTLGPHSASCQGKRSQVLSSRSSARRGASQNTFERSHRPTLYPRRAMDIPRFADEVVLPTPPLPDVTTIMRDSCMSLGDRLKASSSAANDATGAGPRLGPWRLTPRLAVWRGHGAATCAVRRSRLRRNLTCHKRKPQDIIVMRIVLTLATVVLCARACRLQATAHRATSLSDWARQGRQRPHLSSSGHCHTLLSTSLHAPERIAAAAFAPRSESRSAFPLRLAV